MTNWKSYFTDPNLYVLLERPFDQSISQPSYRIVHPDNTNTLYRNTKYDSITPSSTRYMPTSSKNTNITVGLNPTNGISKNTNTIEKFYQYSPMNFSELLDKEEEAAKLAESTRKQNKQIRQNTIKGDWLSATDTWAETATISSDTAEQSRIAANESANKASTYAITASGNKYKLDGQNASYIVGDNAALAKQEAKDAAAAANDAHDATISPDRLIAFMNTRTAGQTAQDAQDMASDAEVDALYAADSAYNDAEAYAETQANTKAYNDALAQAQAQAKQVAQINAANDANQKAQAQANRTGSTAQSVAGYGTGNASVTAYGSSSIGTIAKNVNKTVNASASATAYANATPRKCRCGSDTLGRCNDYDSGTPKIIDEWNAQIRTYPNQIYWAAYGNCDSIPSDVQAAMNGKATNAAWTCPVCSSRI